MASSIKYPTPRRDETVVEELHGEKVSDPYRWMEDPDADETKRFVEAQNDISRPFMHGCTERENISETLTKLWNYPKYGVPRKEGNKYFFSKNNGLQNQSVMYEQEGLEADPVVFLDPNLLSEDGTVSLTTSSFSEDGKLFAYGLAKSGSDWFDIHFKNVETGEDYPDVLKKIKFSGLSWTHDHKGVFYSSYPDHSDDGADGRNTKEHGNQKLFYHRLGTKQSEDIMCCEFPQDPKWMVFGEVSDCGRYLLVFPQKECRDNLVYFADLQALPNGIEGPITLTTIVDKFEYDYDYITNTGSKCVFRTNYNATKYSLIEIDLANPDPKNWTALVAGHKTDVLEWATCIAGKLLLCYMCDVKNALKVCSLSTGECTYEFPLDIGSVVAVSGKKEHSEMFFKFSSMISPGVIYRADMSLAAPEAKVFRETKIEGFDASRYTVEQKFYPSKDGTMIPMFIAGRKDEKRDGTSPCILYGYGGFNVSLTPSFSITQLFFIQHFGYMATPNIRGGGEYGKEWHDGGRLKNKQNCFDDFVAAAEFLCQEGYTCKEKLAIKGGSNGGLLVGACVNQRPDVFGAAIAQVGVMDMLRFHKFTIGYAWCSDFGNPDEKEHFEIVKKYSPLHNIKEPEGDVQYPSVLLTTADHDDRVVPSHSLKFIAELQHTLGGVSKQTNPLIIRVDTKAGHGASKSTEKVIEEVTDTFSFLVRTLGYELK